MKSHSNRRHAQLGGALILFVLVVVIAGATTLFFWLDGTSVKLERNKKSYIALYEAKEALIGYALQHSSKPGTLPCTDTNNNGSGVTLGSNKCAGYIGRLPWKELGVPMLKDGYSECLWYALSPKFRSQMNQSNRQSNPLNGYTTGTIGLVDDNDAPLGSVSPVIAVVFAPNYPLNGQSRSGAATNYCPGDSVASKYLDTKGAINNATGNVAGSSYTFKLGKLDDSFNDQLTYITAKDLYPLLRKRIAREILGNVDVHSGLVRYYETSAPIAHYPCPASTFDGDEDCSIAVGFVPYNDGSVNLQYAALGSWLEDNGWFANTTYRYISAKHINVTVTDSLGSYTCDANMNVVSCASP